LKKELLVGAIINIEEYCEITTNLKKELLVGAIINIMFNFLNKVQGLGQGPVQGTGSQAKP